MLTIDVKDSLCFYVNLYTKTYATAIGLASVEVIDNVYSGYIINKY